MSVALRQSKTVFNLLKPIMQSNIFSQEDENVDKPSIFYIESVTIEHQKLLPNYQIP